jgi:hypothetical protein
LKSPKFFFGNSKAPSGVKELVRNKRSSFKSSVKLRHHVMGEFFAMNAHMRMNITSCRVNFSIYGA